MLNLDITLVFQIVNFLIIIVISKYFIIKPILENIQRRNEKIEYLSKEITSKEEKIKELRKIYDLKLLEVHNKLKEERKFILENLKKDLDERRKKERSKLEKLYKEQIELLQKEYDVVLKTLEEKVPEFSGLIIEQLS
jgi:F-type H+-transporting ATPase subunit b